MNPPMKLWIPGGHGMLGTDLAAAAKDRGHEVVVTDRDLDITDAGPLAAFVARERPTHVINCAAHTAVDKCEQEEALAFHINADGPACIGKIARQAGIHAVQISTDYVFPGSGTRPYSEEDTTGPLSVYGKSKLAGEQRFMDATAGEGAVVRTSWLYGVHGKSFPATMLRLMADREELSVVADQVGRPTYTRDLADVLVAVAERRLAGVWHFANAGEVSWHGFAVAIKDIANARGAALRCRTVKAIPTSAYPTPAARPAYSVLSTDKIEGALGMPARPWPEALSDFFTARGKIAAV